jgi:GMP synthase-like glutamine amidotransferase
LKIAILQHDQTPPGTTIEWCIKRNVSYQVYHLAKGPLPAVEQFDGLIVLGGEINVDEEEKYPWLRQEKILIKTAIEKNKKVIGLCLGAQLIAEVLGGAVKKHGFWEVGWRQIFLEKIDPLLNHSPECLWVFQWHAYAYTLPPGAKRLATNSDFKEQGFIFSTNVIALQFHPEADIAWITEDVASDEYPQGPFVQNLAEIRKQSGLQEPMMIWFFHLLDKFLLII